MMKSNERKYNFPIGEKGINCTEVMRNPDCLGELVYLPMDGMDNLQKLVLHGVETHGKGDFLGTRNPLTGKYEYESYEDAYNKAL